MAKQVWQAFDGTCFDSEEECINWESKAAEAAREEYLYSFFWEFVDRQYFETPSLCPRGTFSTSLRRAMQRGEITISAIWENRGDFYKIVEVLRQAESLSPELMCEFIVKREHRHACEVEAPFDLSSQRQVGERECFEDDLADIGAGRHEESFLRDSFEGSPY
jgi:hypothetical protein